MMIDTHAHLYLPDFDSDLPQILHQAQTSGVNEIWLPAINYDSLLSMEKFRTLGHFHLFAGLHPCDVKADYQNQLARIKNFIDTHSYSGIGEIGLDLYWDKTFLTEQRIAFTTQLNWALERHQPVLIHVRDAFEETLSILRPYFCRGLKGILHSFSGTLSQAQELTDAGFLLGINGIITFKNSTVALYLSQIPLTSIVTETDSPYLSPVPHRGKRNEPSYIPHIIAKLAIIYGVAPETIATQTTSNAHNLLL
jgi:TatD DNase family protein